MILTLLGGVIGLTIATGLTAIAGILLQGLIAGIEVGVQSRLPYLVLQFQLALV